MKLTEEQIAETNSELSAQVVYLELKQSNDFIGFARSFIFSTEHHVARNSLWILTKATDAELAQLQEMLHELTALAMQTGDSSVRRLSMNIVLRLKMEEEDLRTDFLDFCLEHMADVRELPGIQSLCLKLAFRMCQFYPELMGELKRTLEAMEMDYYTPAIKCVRNKILSGKMK